MKTESPQYVLINTIRHALVVMMICFIPHFISAPWWLFIIIFSTTLYRLIADYLGYALPNYWIRSGIVITCLFLLKIEYGSIVSSGFFIGFLLTFIALKSIETHNFRDIKVLILCNFYLIFTALILFQELWIILYLLVAILANLTLMLKLNAPQASIRQMGGNSIRPLLIALPLSIILFYVFPRIADPLWQVPSLSQSTTGFSEKMNPGSIAELFQDDSITIRVTFKNKPVLNGYWRGLILSFYNGWSWNPTWDSIAHFKPLDELISNQDADYELILEPTQKKWLFYLGYPSAGRPSLLFSPNHGLVSQNNKIINQRFNYSLNLGSAPYKILSPNEYIQNTQLPKNTNTKLTAWAKEQYANNQKNTQLFIAFLHHYIHQEHFWYTLSPPLLNSNKNQMDQFWFNTQQGFCEHYASAVSIILRAVGIPARVIVGYQGGSWNPVAQYLTIQQNDAHAWLEYWQEGIGWTELDPTTFIATEHIDKALLELQKSRMNQDDLIHVERLSWFQQFKLLLDSARFFADRWLLFYNQEAQRDLLQKTGLGQWNIATLLQASVGFIILFVILINFFYRWWQKRFMDLLLIEYHLLQKEFRRFNIDTPPSATIKQQCTEIIKKAPHLAPVLSKFLYRYEKIRLQYNTCTPKENKIHARMLIKKLRIKLSKNKPFKLPANHV